MPENSHLLGAYKSKQESVLATWFNSFVMETHSSWLSKDTKQKTLLSIRSFVGKQTKKVKERRLFHQNLSHSMEQIRLSKLSTSALCLYAQKAFCYVCAKNSRIGSNSTKQQKNTFFHQDMFKICIGKCCHFSARDTTVIYCYLLLPIYLQWM